MLLRFGRGISFIILTYLLSGILSVRQYGTPGNTLYVAEDSHTNREKIQIINRNVEKDDSSHLERRKREATTLTSPSVDRNLSTWVIVHFLIIYKRSFQYIELVFHPSLCIYKT